MEPENIKWGSPHKLCRVAFGNVPEEAEYSDNFYCHSEERPAEQYLQTSTRQLTPGNKHPGR